MFRNVTTIWIGFVLFGLMWIQIESQRVVQWQRTPYTFRVDDENQGIDRYRVIFELFDGVNGLFESGIIIENFQNNTEINYKQRVKKIIEFEDLGTPGYQPSDRTVQEFIIPTRVDWQQFQDPEVNGDWETFCVSYNDTIVLAGHIDDSVTSLSSVVSPVLFLAQYDFRNLYEETGTKLAIEVEYLYFEKSGGVDVPVSGILPETIAQNFANPTSVVAFPSGDSISVIRSPFINNTGSALNAVFQTYFTIQSTDHSQAFRNFQTILTPGSGSGALYYCTDGPDLTTGSDETSDGSTSGTGSSPRQEDDDDSNSLIIIVSAVAGGVLLFVFGILLFFVLRRKKKSQKAVASLNLGSSPRMTSGALTSTFGLSGNKSKNPDDSESEDEKETMDEGEETRTSLHDQEDEDDYYEHSGHVQHVYLQI